MILEKDIIHIPNKPGIYLFLEQDNVIYVGKAKNLYKRVFSYLKNKDLKTSKMVARATKVNFIITQTQDQASSLEISTIQRLQPLFNIKIEQERLYYLSITDHKTPALYITYNNTGKSFGPYRDLDQVKSIQRTIQETLRIRTCSQKVFENRSIPCQLFNLGLCSAPCVNFIDQDNYKKDVKKCIDILSGNKIDLENYLKKMIKKAASEYNFNLAIKIRDRLNNINKLEILNKSTNQKKLTVIGSSQNIKIACLYIMQVHDQGITFSNHWNISQININIVQSFIKYYKNIIKIENIVFSDNLLNFINCKYIKLRIRDHYWESIADINADARCKLDISSMFTYLSNIIDKNVNSVECLDISHQNGQFNVAAFASIDKKPIIYDIPYTYNDCLSIERAIIKRMQDNIPLPDLLLVDGGKGQISAVKKHLHDTSVNIIGFAKNSQTLFSDKKPINVNNSSMQIIQYLISLAHNASNRASKVLEHKNDPEVQKLISIPGIGIYRAKQILSKFSIQSLKNEPDTSIIQQVKGININLVKKIKKYLI